MRSFGITLAVLWVSGAIGAFLYSQQQDIPAGIAVPAAAALLVELSLFFGLAFPAVRSWGVGLGSKLPVLMVASALPPYALYCLAGRFDWRQLAILGFLAAAISWWYVLLPRHAAVDLAFLVLVAGVYLLKPFKAIYPPPIEDLRVDVLGQLLWIRLGVAAILLIRRAEGTGFGFVPERREWWIGVKQYLYFMPIGVALMYGLDFAHFEPASGWWWKWPATFIGFLWVVALAEELLFRGLLQQWLTGWFGATAGLLSTALLFGSVHLPYRQFPNWEFAALSAVAGWFYGRAFNEAHGIRAAMVTHALTVATWRTLFR